MGFWGRFTNDLMRGVSYPKDVIDMNLCMKCQKDHHGSDHVFNEDGWDDSYCYCPKAGKRGFIRTFEDPPADCPYILEHTLK